MNRLRHGIILRTSQKIIIYRQDGGTWPAAAALRCLCLFVDAQHTEQVVVADFFCSSTRARSISQMQAVTTEISAYNHALETQSDITRRRKWHNDRSFLQDACVHTDDQLIARWLCACLGPFWETSAASCLLDRTNYLCYINIEEYRPCLFFARQRMKNTHIYIRLYFKPNTLLANQHQDGELHEHNTFWSV